MDDLARTLTREVEEGLRKIKIPTCFSLLRSKVSNLVLEITLSKQNLKICNILKFAAMKISS